MLDPSKYVAVRELFGDQFDLLPGALIDPDPVERMKALSFIESYLDTCMEPLKHLQYALSSARHDAKRKSREDCYSSASWQLPDTIELDTEASRAARAKAQVRAGIEAMIAAPPKEL